MRTGLIGSVLSLALLSLAACGAGHATVVTGSSASALPRRLVVSVVTGSISRHRADGTAWHVTQPDPVLPILGEIAAVSFGLPPNVGAQAGHALAGDAHELPPSTKVRVQFGGSMFDSHGVPRSLSPVWQYRVAIDASSLDPTTPVAFSVIDTEGGESLGRFTTTIGALANSSGMMLENNGEIESLQIGVERSADAPAHAAYRFHIPANASMQQLAAQASRPPRAPGDWQGIRVLNGDRVHVRASGAVRPSCGFFGSPGAVASPDGIRDRWSDYSVEGFGGLPHAALVALCAGQARLVGRETEFTIEKPGMLLLFVNDSDAGNNCGEGFDVDVAVN